MVMRRTEQHKEKNALFGGDVWLSSWIYSVLEVAALLLTYHIRTVYIRRALFRPGTHYPHVT
jgi:hypothetical protein